jgi:hypothetical protein
LWCCIRTIEQRGQPRWAETDVDPVDLYVDPLDQAGKDSALAGHR